MYLVNLRFGSKLCWSVLFSIMLIVGWAITPAQAHCKGKHTGTHEHCINGGEPPSQDFNPEIVWRDGSRSIVIANRDGSNPTTVLSDGRKTGIITSVSWSPGGNEILLTRAAGEQDPAGVYRLPIFIGDRDGNGNGQFSVGTPTPVVESDVRKFGRDEARWSPVPAPDGYYWIAYTDLAGETGHEIFLFNPVTDKKIQLTETEEDFFNFTWSHDATRIAVHTSPDNVQGEDIKIYSLTEYPLGNLVVEPGDPVSLLLDNNEIDDKKPLSNAAMLKQIANAPEAIDFLDWANTSHRLIVSSSGDGKNQLWIVPVPEDGTQKAVADGTVLVIDDTEVGRIWPGWSPKDTALLYRRAGAGGTCSVPPKKGHPNGVPALFVIGKLTSSGESEDGPLELKCENEIVLDLDGFNPEWWRGTFPDPPDPPLPLPSP